MALDATLEGVRSRVLDSVKGRKLGLTVEGFIAGIPAEVQPISSHTSLGSTLIPNYGISLIHTTTSGSNFTLQAPSPGIAKQLIQDTTGGGVVTLASGSFQTSGSSTGTILTFASSYFSAISLQGLSTAIFFIRGALSSGVTLT